MSHGPNWSDDEIEIIRENAHLPIAQILEKLPGRTEDAVHSKRVRLGLGPGQPPEWSDEEIAILRANAQLPMDQLLEKLPVRTERALQMKLSRLRIHRQHPDEWSEAEINMLRECDHLTAPQAAKKLPGRSVEAIRAQRSRLGCGPGQALSTSLQRVRASAASVRQRELMPRAPVTIRRFSFEGDA